MSSGGRSDMPRIILHRSTERLHLQYEDGFREQIFDKERMRWLLLEGHALVIIFLIIFHYFSFKV